MADEYVTRCGGNVRGMSDSELIKNVLRGRAFAGVSTFDFPLLLGDLANHVLLNAADEAEVTWPALVEIVDAADFRPRTLVDVGALPTLDLLKENGEYKDVHFKESGQTGVIKRRGNMARMTFEMFKNDDLGAFMRMPRMFGSAYERTINELVYGLLASNPKLSDKKPVFAAE
ncbi:MAG: hypothetical protein MI749_13785, partial [Desulfovibrionales bacterium]|nr:hypothetical protein [Desulfovibrionales bacterium]